MSNSEEPHAREPVLTEGERPSSTDQSPRAESATDEAQPSQPGQDPSKQPVRPTPAPWLELAQAYVTPLGLVLLAMLLLGVYLRLHDFGFPKTLQFDEHHFVETARGYLRHQPDWNDHPPLGKLVIAMGIDRFGDTSFGFRFPALVSGFLTIVLGAWAARRLFAAKWSAAVAFALLSADGFLIAYSRAALLDGFLATSAMAALVAATFPISITWGCVAGLILGISASVKFSGIAVAVPLLFVTALASRPRKEKLLALGAMAAFAAFVYFSSYALGLGLANKPNGYGDVIADTQRLLKHHAELTDMKNPATSGWITWVLPKRPLLLGFTEQNGAVRALSTLGNLATWWSAVAITVLAIGVFLRHGWATVLNGRAEQAPESDTLGVQSFVLQNGRSVTIGLLLALAFVAPWVLTHRDSYVYHFLPAYAPLVVLLSGFLAWSEPKHRERVLVFAAVALVVAAYYAPLWSYLPLSRDAFNARLFLQSWR